MKKHILASLAALGAASLSSGWFWSMGCTWEPGEKLGLAYMTTVACAAGAYALALFAKKKT